MTKKKAATDSSAEIVKNFMRENSGVLPPPPQIKLPPAAIPFWIAIANSRSRGEWERSPSLVTAAANLARTQHRIDQCWRYINGIDPMPEGKVEAQFESSLLKLQRVEMSYLRILQQHAAATEGGNNSDAHKRREEEKAQGMGEEIDHNLIPMN